MAVATGRLPSEWEREEPAAIATTFEILEEIKRREQANG